MTESKAPPPAAPAAAAAAAAVVAPSPTRCLRWCVWSDPCGLACALLAVATVLLVDYVTVAHVVAPWFGLASLLGALHAGGFQLVIALILASYVRCMTTDPGSVPVGSASDADRAVPVDDPDRLFKPKRRFCEQCKCIKPPRAHHCSTCGRCVNKMDHHCPWVNNCVGSNNFKFFLLFLLWTFSGALYGAAMAVARLLACYGALTHRGLQLRGGAGARAGGAAAAAAASAANSFGRRLVAFLAARSGGDSCALPDTAGIVLLAVSTVMAIFFVIFTACMAYDQYQGMTTDVTGIEYIKQWREAPRPLWSGLEEACGEPFSWRWLVPVAQPHPSPALYQWTAADVSNRARARAHAHVLTLAARTHARAHSRPTTNRSVLRPVLCVPAGQGCVQRARPCFSEVSPGARASARHALRSARRSAHTP
jgi:hypothetical protein